MAQEAVYLIPPVHLLPLKKMETNAYGLDVPGESDVLNQDVWKNASYSVTAAKFEQIPDRLPAEAERLRLALAKLAAEPPQGTADQAFITLKLQLLFNRAQFDDAYKLLQKVPEKVRSDSQKKIYADILLTRNLQTACFLKETDGDDPFWQELAAVCAASAKEENKAFLALDLLKEQEQASPFLTNAVELFLYGKPLTTQPEEITPLTVAVWRACGRSLSDLKHPDKSVWFQALFARDETIPVEKRLKTAEILVQNGILPSSNLRTYYQQVSFERYKNKTLPPEITRAQYIQQAAGLSSRSTDNLKKQSFLKKGLQSAKSSRVSYAFSSAAKDILETIKPDPETLGESAEMIEAFVLSGLNDQALDWSQKAEILFPVSETTADGWYFAELAETDKNRHFFIPTLENVMAYAEKKKAADNAFIAKTDRLMLAFQMLDMIQPDETWRYTSFAEGSQEEEASERKKQLKPHEKPVGDTVLEALRELNGTYAGLLNALSLLSGAGMDREAALLTAQSADLILHPDKAHE